MNPLKWLQKRQRQFTFFLDPIIRDTYRCEIHSTYNSKCEECRTIMKKTLDEWWSKND